jgi:hypothetical protein
MFFNADRKNRGITGCFHQSGGFGPHFAIRVLQLVSEQIAPAKRGIERQSISAVRLPRPGS